MRDYRKNRLIPLIIPVIIVCVLVYFSSGYFYYWAIAVATGSMKPVINKGDVVLIEKNNNYSKYKKGDIIAFRYSNVVIVHRIINIINDNGTIYFYTKGDANKEKDNFVVKENMIVGRVNSKIPFIGIPTVWLSEF